jgi:hypothetical protein
MFGRKMFKGFMKTTEQSISALWKANHALVVREDLVECEHCGCLLIKSTAIRAESVVKKRQVIASSYRYITLSVKEEEYIYTPYYCKSHSGLIGRKGEDGAIYKDEGGI